MKEMQNKQKNMKRRFCMEDGRWKSKCVGVGREGLQREDKKESERVKERKREGEREKEGEQSKRPNFSPDS